MTGCSFRRREARPVQRHLSFHTLRPRSKHIGTNLRSSPPRMAPRAARFVGMGRARVAGRWAEALSCSYGRNSLAQQIPPTPITNPDLGSDWFRLAICRRSSIGRPENEAFMSQIIFPEDSRSAARGPAPIRPDPTVVPEPRWVRVGRGTFPFSSFAAASAAYRAAIERLDLGVSEAPACEVLDDAEKTSSPAWPTTDGCSQSPRTVSPTTPWYCTRPPAPDVSGRCAGRAGSVNRQIDKAATCPTRA